jgi:hypothetical protein
VIGRLAHAFSDGVLDVIGDRGGDPDQRKLGDALRAEGG